MDAGTMRGVLTLILFLAFIGIVFWAYGRGRRKDFEEAARLPLADEPDRNGSGKK